jgi:hypothetical protein
VNVEAVIVDVMIDDTTRRGAVFVMVPVSPAKMMSSHRFTVG